MNESSPAVLSYLAILWRQKWIILLITVIGGLAAFGRVQLEDPRYRATAEMLLGQKGLESSFGIDTNNRGAIDRSINTEVRVVQSAEIRQRVREAIGKAPSVLVRAYGQSNIIQIVATATDPDEAASVANAYANAFVEYRKATAIEDIETGIESLAAKVAEFQTEIDAIDRQIADAPEEEQTALSRSLGQRRAALVSQQTVYVNFIDNLQIDLGLTTGGARVITPATGESTPFSPKPRQSTVVGIMLGFLLGCAAALLRDLLDTSVRSADDLERATHLPNLAVIPNVPRRLGPDGREEAVLAQLGSPAAEAYRTLRTAVSFLDFDDHVQVVAITSAAPGEGKTTTVANLAVAMASAGRRVVVVSGDLRRPRVHQFFGAGNDVGMTSVLLGLCSLDEAVQRGSSQQGGLPIAVLSSGPTPPNPSELLAAPRATALLRSLRDTADVVLIDCPPVLPVTDAVVLARSADAVLLVAAAGITSTRQLSRAIGVLQQVDAPVAGTVLNRLDEKGAYTYVYVSDERGGSERSVGAGASKAQ